MFLGVDFGTSSTVLAVSDGKEAPRVIELPPFSMSRASFASTEPAIPSLITYNHDGSSWIGAQVLNKAAARATNTFRLMKTYLTDDYIDTPRTLSRGQKVSNRDAAEKFLLTVLQFAQASHGPFQNVCLTMPVGVSAHYGEWLTGVAKKAGFPVPSVLDEPTAASVGYEQTLKIGDHFLVVDFGGGTLDVACVELNVSHKSEQVLPSVKTLGLSGADLGGSEIDAWIADEICVSLKLADDVANGSGMLNDLLLSAQAAKERLSFKEESSVSVIDPETGGIVEYKFARVELEQLLQRRGLFERLDETIQASINQARGEGVTLSELKAVLLIGGSNLIPSVRSHIAARFKKTDILDSHPFSAVALGAARVAAGTKVVSKTTHDYALRYVDDGGAEKFEIIVPSGLETPARDVWSGVITSTQKGQTSFEITVYRRKVSRTLRRTVEILFGSSGQPKISKSEPKSKGFSGEKLVSKPVRTVPSTRAGEACLEASFSIDDQKRLLASVSDVRRVPNLPLLEDEQLTSLD
jgi:molecular chaperone DnaK (HSP70)